MIVIWLLERLIMSRCVNMKEKMVKDDSHRSIDGDEIDTSSLVSPDNASYEGRWKQSPERRIKRIIRKRTKAREPMGCHSRNGRSCKRRVYYDPCVEPDLNRLFVCL